MRRKVIGPQRVSAGPETRLTESLIESTITVPVTAASRGTSVSSAPRHISVVIPAFNAAGTLGAQLEALASQTYAGAWEVIVVDNGSTDGTFDVASRWVDSLPRLRVIHATERAGAAYARNEGAGAARGDFLAFCDADDVVTPEWLQAMAQAAQRADLVGGPQDAEALNDARTRSQRVLQSDGLPIGLGFLPYIVSANLGIWARAFRQLGGWNEDFPRAGGEDLELSWRAQLAGLSVCFAPEAAIHYRFRRRLRAMFRQFYVYGRSHARLYAMFRHTGLKRNSFPTVLLIWLNLLLHAPNLLRGPRRRRMWLILVALRCGRIRGSMETRVAFL